MAKAKNNEEVSVMTPEMKALKQALYEPFPENKVLVRDGRAGQKWKYIDSAEYVNRLNEVFGVAWAVEEIKSEVAGSVLRTLVRITVPDPNNINRVWHKEAWASHPLADSRGRAYDPGDVAKSAYSKALVKACSLLGVGLQQLWGIDTDNYSDNQFNDSPPWEGPSQFQQNNEPNYSAGAQSGPARGIMPNQFTPSQVHPPQLNNPNASMVPTVPQQQVPNMNMGLGPVPQMSNPNPNMGFTNGPGTSAQAQVQFQTAPVQQQQQHFVSQQPMAPPMAQTQGGIAAHQISAIRGAATMNGFPDPMFLVRQVLGVEANSLQMVEELTHDQAIKVLEYVRQIQGV